MKLLQLQYVHGITINSRGNCEWNESHNEVYLSSGSVINVLNIRTAKIIRHISTNYNSFPIKCFTLTNNYKYMFTIQHEIDSNSFEPLISCIVIENQYKYKITLNNPFNNQQLQNEGKTQFTSLTQSIVINEDKMIIFTKNELYVIQINFAEIHKLSLNSLLQNQNENENKNNKTLNAQCISLDIIGYLHTTNYSPNFNDKTETQLFDVLWFDKNIFISSGNRHLSIWRLIDNNLQTQTNNIDVIRQKFKFGKYKNKKKNKNQAPIASIANAPNTSSTLRKITFKLGIFANACFVSMAFGDSHKTKDTLFVITKKGILCTFHMQAMYLQKWVNLRMENAYYITIKSSLLFCCGTPDKNRLFDSYSLRHLGSLSATMNGINGLSIQSVASSIATVHNANATDIYKQSSILQLHMQPNGESDENNAFEVCAAAVVDSKIINDGKKIICIYNNGNVMIWNMIKQEKENNNCVQYKFNIFRSIERNKFNKAQNQIIQLPNNDLIVLNENGYLKCISNRIVSTALPTNLQMEQNISHIIPCFECKSLIVISSNQTANIYHTDPIKLKQRVNILEINQDEINQIKVSLSSTFIAMDGVNDKNAGTLKIIHTNTPTEIFSIINMKFKIIDFDFWSDENGIFIFTANGLSSYSFEMQQLQTIKVMTAGEKIIRIQTYPSGKFIILFSEKSNKITVWNIEQRCLSRTYELPHIANKIMFDSSGLYLVASCCDNNIYFIDWFSGRIIYAGLFHVSSIIDMIFCFDLNSLITLSNDGLIAKWILPTKIKNAIKQRQGELNQTHSIILDSFNELKQIQLQLPGHDGLEFEDISFDHSDSVHSDSIKKEKEKTPNAINCKNVIDEPLFIEQKAWKKDENAIMEYLIDVSVTSSIEIPSLQSIELKNVNSSKDGMSEILKQMKILESNPVLFDTKNLIDLKIILNNDENENDDENQEKELCSNTFPIQLKIEIDANKVLKKSNDESEEKIKLTTNKNDNENNEFEIDEEASLLLSCFENNLMNFANCAKQLHSLSLLLKMKNLPKEEILKRLEQNITLKRNLQSISDSFEWIRDLIFT